ncbi:MAG: hypothetical protein FWJ65_07665 [Limnochordales bacterium]
MEDWELYGELWLAAVAHDLDLLELEDLDEDQLDYLERVDELGDPLSDGLGCEYEDRD